MNVMDEMNVMNMNKEKLRKKKLRKMLYIYTALMLILIFSSNTIYNFSLPRVVVAMPTSGRLTKELEVHGVTAFSEIIEIYATASGQIDEILVKKGDIVNENTTIATFKKETSDTDTASDTDMDTDTGTESDKDMDMDTATATDVELRLAVERIENQLASLALNKSYIQDKLQALSTQSNDDIYAYQNAVEDAKRTLEKQRAVLLEAQNLTKTPFDDYDYQQVIDNAERDWKRKQIDAENMRLLEESGAIALAEATAAQLAADDAERVYNRAVGSLDMAKEKAGNDAQAKLTDAKNAVADAQTALERTEASLERAKTNFELTRKELAAQLDFELSRTELDIERANIDLLAAQVNLAKASSESDAGIVSEYSGIVLSIEKNKGQFVSPGEKIATVGINNGSFVIEISCQESEGRFIEIGDEANIRVGGLTHSIKAIVYEIVPVGDMLKICLVCKTEELTGGEYIAVKFHKQTEVFDLIVPNEAIFRDAMGSFIWVVSSKAGALGTEYISKRVKVLIADMDDYYTAISRGMDFFEPVVVSYSKDLTINGRVSRME